MNKAILNECIALIANEIIKKANEPGGANNADLRASLHSLGGVAATLGSNHHEMIAALAQNWLVRYEHPAAEFGLLKPFIHPGALNAEELARWLFRVGGQVQLGEAPYIKWIEEAKDSVVTSQQSLDEHRNLIADTLTASPREPTQNQCSREAPHSV